MRSYVLLLDLDTALAQPSQRPAPAPFDLDFDAEIFRFDQNVFFIRTDLDIADLTDRIGATLNRPKAEFFLAELDAHRLPHAGSLPPSLWDFLGKRLSLSSAA